MIKTQLTKVPVILFLIILFIFFYLLIIDRNPRDIPSALLNKKAPEFKTESLIRDEIFSSKKHLNGQITLVNFFATWCKPCRDEHKYIKKFSENKKIKLVGINFKDNSEKTVKWLKKYGNPYSVIAIDKNGFIAIDWGVYGIPETFILHSTGTIKFRHVGPITKKIYSKIDLIIKELENNE